MTLVKYIRNKNGHPYGAVVAVDPKHIGWSLCHVAPHEVPVRFTEADGNTTLAMMEVKGDVFSKARAIQIAEARALKGYDLKKVPESVREELDNMKHRAERYFKSPQL